MKRRLTYANVMSTAAALLGVAGLVTGKPFRRAVKRVRKRVRKRIRRRSEG
jgi:hypothetical protein